jgi:hypothetical protein
MGQTMASVDETVRKARGFVHTHAADPRLMRRLRRRAKTQAPAGGESGSGPNPLLVLGVALIAGYTIAKVIDWRGHAHPRR